MNRTVLSFTPPVCWLIISAVLLTLPGSVIPQENWLDKIWFDKWVHIGMFSIMVFLWCRAIFKTRIKNSRLKRAFLLLALLFLAYGIAMEFVQKYFIPNRSFDVEDIAADAIGCMAGLIYSIRRFIKK